jgi:hypothetical protein
MANFGLGYYGSGYNVALTLNTSQNVNLYNFIIANSGWRNTSKKLKAIITIPAGQTIYSTNPLLPALTVPADGAASFRSYDYILIRNFGTIAGAAGVAGLGAINGTDGGIGGTAIRALRNLSINNQGNIYGGGGGGGGGGGHTQGVVQIGFPPAEWFLNCNGNDGAGCCGDNNNYCTFSNNGGADCAADSFCGCTDQRPGAITRTEDCSAAGTAADCGCNWGACGGTATNCEPRIGGNGGKGRGYLVPNVDLLGQVSPGLCMGFGGNGGDWGQVGDPGENGCTTPFGSRNPGLGGNGGLAGYWIDGVGFLNLTNGNIELGRTV